MEEKEYIEIVLAADDNYAKFCAVTMVSILENTKNPIRFHIFDGGIKEFHQNKLLKLEKQYNCKIIFYSMDKLELPKVPLNRNWISVATYYRLFITDVIPFNIDKIIYLDCDIIVDKDISELWNYDISKYMAGAVEDEHSIPNHGRLELSDKHTYFNAGVLLLNLQKLREFNLKDKSFEYLKNNISKIEMQDQDILNGILEENVLELPLKFNANTTVFYPYYKCSHKYSESDSDFAKENAVIIHYTGTPKAWLNPELEQSDYFWKYARKTNFYEEIIFYNNIFDSNTRLIVKNVVRRKENYIRYFKYTFLNSFLKKTRYIEKLKKIKTALQDCKKTLKR